MLGKPSLKPSLLLEVAFMLVVWLSAWLIFHASLTVTIIAVFGVYALVFLYEKWFDRRTKRERSEPTRLRRGPAARFGRADRPEQPLPGSNTSVSETRKAEPEVSTRPILKRLVAELHESEAESEAGLPPEVIAAEVVRAREQAERERAERERVEKERAEREQAERERAERERVEKERAEREAREQAVAEKAAEPEPEPEAAPEPPQERRSLMAEIAAAPGKTIRTHAVGGWNIWQLERMMAARLERDEERDYERSLLLVYMREFADSDGQLPPELDELVHESFGDLVHGPAAP